MTNSISFIHAADLHLDSPFKGLTDIPSTVFKDVRESTFGALDRLIHTAIVKQVDFILLVGDLFDNEKQSLKAQVHLRKAFQTLQDHQIEVFLSYGNHDHILGNPYRLAFPENVHVFSSEHTTQFIYEKNAEKLAAIYGFSYHNRAVKSNKTPEYEIKDSQIPFHIATLHGTLHGNQAHDPYAPFTLQQLQEKGFDYWALGHIHERAVLQASPPIIYPGNTQGRHRNEAGDKGCYYVEMTSTNCTYDFIPLQNIQFVEHVLDISHCDTVNDVEQAILSITEAANGKQLIHLTLTSKENNLRKLTKEGIITELIDVVNETLIDKADWQYIYTYRTKHTSKPTSVMEERFVNELEQAIEQLEMKEVLADLYQHPVARKYIKEEDEHQLKQEAKQLLLYELLHTEESDQT